jgi:hypothetical protein
VNHYIFKHGLSEEKTLKIALDRVFSGDRFRAGIVLCCFFLAAVFRSGRLREKPLAVRPRRTRTLPGSLHKKTAQRSRTGARGSLMFPLQERHPRTSCAQSWRGRGVSPLWGFDRQGGARKRGVQGGRDRGGGRQGACPFDPGKVRGPALQSSRACTKPNPRGFSLSRLSSVSRKLASGLPTCCQHFAVGFRLLYLQQHAGLIGIVVRWSRQTT